MSLFPTETIKMISHASGFRSAKRVNAKQKNFFCFKPFNIYSVIIYESAFKHKKEVKIQNEK